MKAVRPIAICVLAIIGSALEIYYLSGEMMRRNPKSRITIDVSPHWTRSDDIAVIKEAMPGTSPGQADRNTGKHRPQGGVHQNPFIDP